MYHIAYVNADFNKNLRESIVIDTVSFFFMKFFFSIFYEYYYENIYVSVLGSKTYDFLGTSIFGSLFYIHCS